MRTTHEKCVSDAPDVHVRNYSVGAKRSRYTGTQVLGLAGLLALTAAAPQAATTFLESGGRVVMEAEHFDSKLDNADGHKWIVVPDDGKGSAQGSTDFTNARGGKYIQSVPDVAGGGTNHNQAGDEDTPPSVDYKMKITTTGKYHLYLKWGGYDGSSDSVYAQIAEVGTPGHYRFSRSGGTDLNAAPWQGIAGSEKNNGGPDADDGPATFDIATAGTYTLRISMREDGSVVDAIAFQLDSLPEPSGIGSSESATEGNVITQPTPVITRQPSDTAGPVGGTAVFRVGVSNNIVPASIKWFKNGTEIAGANDLTLTTATLATGDTGAKYKAVLSNSSGASVTTREAVLTVVPVTPKPGLVKVEVFTGISGTAVGDLTNNAAFPNSPSSIEFVKFLEYPAGADDGTAPAANVMDNYGIRISGFLTPKTTGDYTFYVASDDNSSFFLSTDASAANKKLIAWEPQWNPVRDFSTTTRRPGCDAGDCENVSNPVHLEANKRYYFEGYMKEGGGGDNFAVAMSSDGSVPDTSSLPIGTEFLSSEVAALGIVEQPQDLAIEENRSGTLSVSLIGPGGYTFQWQSAAAGSSTFTDIAGETKSTMNVTALQANAGKQYRVIVKAGNETATSNAATLTVTPDVTAPKITGAGSVPGGVLLYFNEAVGPGANVPGNYTLSGGATVTGATQVGPQTVFVQTGSALTAGTSYTVTVNNVKDAAAGGGNAVSPNTVAVKGSPALPSVTSEGLVPYERWENLNPSTIAQLQTEIASRPPDVTETQVGFERPDNAVDNHGDRLSGWFIPPSDGNYVFAGCSDDNGRLFLSTDADPANKKLIALQPQWDNYRIWSSGFAEKHSDTFAATEWPTGNRISLKGGQPYYIEYIWQDGGGGDDGGATFWKEGEPVPANGSPSTLRGAAIKGAVATPTSGPPLILAAPKGQSFNKGDNITLTVSAIGTKPFQYQWFKNKKPIQGATSATLTINNADYNAVGDYNVHVTNGEGEADSGFRSGDDASRLIMNGAFVIEGEDYNYEGGKHVPASDVMPYTGDAYKGLKPTPNIDFFNNNDESGGAAFAYNRHKVGDEFVVEMKGPADPPDYNRGSFNVTANYAIGWTDVGDWQNYTRVFPKGKYVVFNAAAHDGVPDLAVNEINQILSKVAKPTVNDNSSAADPGGDVTEGGAQGLTKLGTFLGPATGAWSSNDLIPLQDDNGAIKQIDLDGETTLRLTFNEADGDLDYLLFYCLDCASNPNPTPAKASVAISGGNVTVSSDSGGTVEATDSLVPANWQAIGPAPQTVPANSKKAQFFRIKK